MNISFPKYDEYQHSGMQWLGMVPSHWHLIPNRFLFQEKKDVVGKRASDFTLLSLTLRGVVPRDMENPQGKFPAEFNTYKIVAPDDLVFCLFDIEETPRTVGHAAHHGMITGAYTVLECGSRALSRYLYYYYLSLDFDKRLQPLYSGLRKVIPRDRFFSIKSPVPPLKEQTRIAAFLDEKTAEIDDAIAKKQRLIELLQEQKAILINRAVTQGLDPNVSMRDSGVAWIGQVPAHWEISRSKWLFNVRKERARPDDIQLSATQAYGVISQQEYMDREGRRVTQITEHLDKRAHVEVDDFVISMRSFEGGLERAWASGCIRSSYVVLEPTPQVDPDFFTYLFKSQAYIQALRATANFIRDGQDLNFNNFKLVDLPVIPIEEQKAIANYLNQATKALAEAAELTQREIDLLREFRTILISDAVTGKIKV